MCGIAGFAVSGGFEENLASKEAEAMAAALSHRGPDASGVWIDSKAGIAFAHRRLSVLDLTKSGSQPMVSASGRYVISYNGEIYNHEQIRHELRGNNFHWRGTSDTESLLAAIETWGLDRALKKIVGMYAFSLWDKNKRELTLVRDRMGEKPLYYGLNNGRFFFGSELKAFRAHPQFKGDINRDSIALYMRHNCVPAPYSIYLGINKLMPGSYVTVPMGDLSRTGDINPVHYWSLESVASNQQRNIFDGSQEEALVELERLLIETIRGQSLADVPLGAFLSGGIDSSLVVALMQANSSKPIKTFTVGFEDEVYNEASHAMAVASHLQTDHTELYVTPKECRAVIPRLPELYDEPFADSSQIPTSLISKLASSQVTVALSGDGGDEIFGGYNRYIWTRNIWSKLKWLPNIMKSFVALGLKSASYQTWDRLYGLVDFAIPSRHKITQAGLKVHKLSDVMTASNPDLFYRALVSHWKCPSDIVLNSREPKTILTSDIGGILENSIEQRMMLIDGLSYLPDDILVKVDRASMGESLETRIPLIDHRIVEFAWNLPLDMKINSGTGKWVLRKLLGKYLKKELFERPKMGFGIPLGNWLRGPLRDWSEDLLSRRRLEEEGFFEVNAIRDTWNQHLKGQSGLEYRLWDVLVYQAWHQANKD